MADNIANFFIYDIEIGGERTAVNCENERVKECQVSFGQ